MHILNKNQIPHFAILFCLLFLCVSCYSVRQSWHQLGILYSAKEIKDVLDDPKIDLKTKEKLKIMPELICFAKDNGFNTKDAYETYAETGQSAVSYLVIASEPFKLKLHTWWFPFVGSVPYLGFFDLNECKETAKDLEKDGYDTSVVSAAAFSSLGWFHDPVYDSMLNLRETDLIETIFHELVHRTLWIKNSPEFSENMAEYVSSELVIKFLTQKEKFSALEQYSFSLEDKKLFIAWLTKLKNELEMFYKTVPEETSDVGFTEKKNEIFQKHVAMLPTFKTKDYAYLNKKRWNNASVLASSLYLSRLDEFKTARSCVNNLSTKDFLNLLKEKTEANKDPYKALASLCSKV